MREAIGRNALWAMEPTALANLLQRNVIEDMLPAGLQSLFAMGQPAAAKPADPVREGSTLVIPLDGTLSPRGGWSGTSTEAFANTMRESAADDRVGAIVLKIMSPGGLVWGTQEAADAVYDARQSKPVVAVADKYAFSAAHWIATQASAFYVTPSGQVGSVGVRGGHVDQSAFEDKIGMKTTLVASDPKKIAGHPYAPLSDEDRAEMQAEINEMATAFNAAIARGRGMAAADVPGMHGTGQVFSAQRAAQLGVTDGVMTLRDVVTKYGSSRSRLDLMRRRAALHMRMIEI
jgi:capsid assembly protease